VLAIYIERSAALACLAVTFYLPTNFLRRNANWRPRHSALRQTIMVGYVEWLEAAKGSIAQDVQIKFSENARTPAIDRSYNEFGVVIHALSRISTSQGLDLVLVLLFSPCFFGSDAVS